jgi:hypothetical protein
MRQSSKLILPCDTNYTAHWEAEKRRKKTREWLRQREHDLAQAPSIVSEVPEAAAPAEGNGARELLRKLTQRIR